MQAKKTLLTILGICLLFSCKENDNTQIQNSAVVYYGGDILTMSGNEPEYADALVVKNGKIQFIGASKEAMETAGSGHKMINLEGKT